MLSDLQIKNAKARATPYRLADSNGLSLAVSIAGGKSFRLKYRIDGKEKLLTLGKWPRITLARARELATLARNEKAEGRDPAIVKRQVAATARISNATTLEGIAYEYHADNLKLTMAVKQHKTWIASLEKHIFPNLGKLPITDVTLPMVFTELKRIQKNYSVETGNRIRQRLDTVFSFALLSSRCASNPAAMVKGAMIRTNNSGRQPAILKLPEIRHVWATVAAYPSSIEVQGVSQMIALTVARSDEVRGMPWTELHDLGTDDPYWLIPSARRKGTIEEKANVERSFVIPLSPAAIAIIDTMRQLNGGSTLVFPSPRFPNRSRTLSDSTISAMYRRAGFEGEHVPHGWRSSFFTILSESHFASSKVLNAALAHFPKGVEGRYDRAKHLARRRPALVEWARMLTAAD